MSIRKKIIADRKDFLSGMGTPELKEFKPDPFQLNAISSAVKGQDTSVVAPTGAGKTFIAIEAIKAAMDLSCRAVYTTPLKALSNSKYSDFKEKFEPQYIVGILTGDRKIDTSADVVVATTEIYRNELYTGESNYSLAVLDEVHYIADVQRGAVWEEAILLTPKDTTLLMLSASISNYEEIADWLESVRGRKCNVVIAKERPVELRMGFMHPDLGIMPLFDSKGSVYDAVSQVYKQQVLGKDNMRLKKKGGFRGPKKNTGKGSRFKKGRK